MTLADFISRFPRLTTIDTGGGCTALTMSISADRYVLLTDDDCRAPTEDSVGDDTEAHVTIALYAADGSVGGREADDYNFVTLSDAAMLIESWNADGECERCASYGEAHTAACPLHPDHDPTPWCGYCGAKQAKHCHCGPLAAND